jgi:hypothetical protein
MGKERLVGGECSGVKSIASGAGLFLGGGSDGSQLSYTLQDASIKSGYHILKSDKFMLLAEVMNYSPDHKEVYLVTEYEYLPSRPADWWDTHEYIISLQGCGNDPAFDLPSKVYTSSSKPFKIPFKGTIVNGIGHLHDGGSALQIYLNENVICNSTAQYGQGAEYVSTGQASGDGNWKSISDMDECTIKKDTALGDTLHIVANYDLGLHPL